MNRIYRSIWNEKTGTVVAASEHARSTGGHNSAGTKLGGVATHVLRLLLMLPLLLPFAPNTYALPVGGVVTAGGASIGRGENSNTITQSSQNVAINWQSFNIGQGESVRFIQPNSHSIALNRVLGPDPSSIFGKLSANGKVFLVNPNGILFGSGAQVNVGGLVASTLNISDIDFMAGRFKFSGHSHAAVINQGTITADGGYVALLGAHVSNEGVIQARLGTIALAAGQAMTLDMAGDGLLNVAIDRGAMNALAENGGLLHADGGHVLMTAQAAGNLLPSAVNTRGIIQAQSIDTSNGTIRLLGDMQGGTVNVSGTLDVSAPGSGKVGGDVTATGHHVGLNGARIDASGATGGGSVLIGGGYQGGNPAVANASATYMSADSMITADAITQGDGGKIVLWADNSTRVHGSLSARGGARSGDGGMIETSGHWLDVAGIHINTVAPSGAAGTWLLDPLNVTITAASSAGAFGLTGDTNIWTPSATASTVSNADISNKLETTNVTIQTNGNGGAEAGTITVTAPITRAAGGPLATTLTLTPDPAVGTIVIAATGAISGSGGNPLNVNLNAVGGTVSVSAPIATFGGTFLSTGTTFTSPAGGTITTAGGALSINHTGFITINDNLSSAGGNIAITGSDLTLTTPATLNSGAGSVTLKPKTATSIGIGTGGGAFTVSDDELSRVLSTGTITIGDRNLASAVIAGGITAGTKNFRLATGGTINDVGTTALTFTTGSLTLDAASTIGNTTPFDVTVTKLAVITEASFDINNAGTLSELSVTTNGSAASQNLISTGLVYTVAEAASNTAITNVTSASGLNFSYQNTVGNIDLGAVNVGSGTISVTSAGNLSLSGAVQTTNSSAQAVILHAGNGLAAGNASGGNILITGGSLSMGAGGRATLFTGSVAGSTGLTALVGSGSGHFRYNSNETTINYTTALGAGTYAIYREQPTLTITATSPAAITYGTATPALTTAVSGVNGDTAAQALSTAATVAVAGPVSGSGKLTATSHTLTPSGAVDTLGYALSYVNGTLTVSPLALVGSLTAGNSLYGAALAPGTASFSNIVGADLVTPAAVLVNTAGLLSSSNNLRVGTHIGIESVSTVLAGADASNYSFTGLTANYAVTPLNTDIHGSRIYDGSVTANSTSITAITALIGSDTVSVTGSGAVSTKDVGSNKAITNIGSLSLAGGDAGNYTLVDGTLTISQAALTITADNKNKVYGAVEPTLSASYSAFQPGDDSSVVTGMSLVTATGAAATTGTHTIDVSGASATNYAITEIDGTLTVSRAALTITADDKAKVYGAADPVLTASYGAFQYGDTPAVVSGLSLTTVTGAAATAGTHTIDASGASASNYTIAEIDGTLTVSKAALTITADDKAKVYGAADPVLTASYGAFQYGDTSAVVSGLSLATVTGTAAKAGTHTIDAAGASALNYSIIEVDGTLTVTPLALIGSITAADKTYDATNSAIITGRSLTGVLGTDAVTYSGGTAVFDTPLVGIGKPVTATALGLSGADASNYTVNSTAATTATITPVVVPPVIPPVIPPIVLPPVEPPPVVLPPVEPPPVVLPPVVLPPVVLPPVEPPPVTPPPIAPPDAEKTSTSPEPPAAEEKLGTEEHVTPTASLQNSPTVMPRVVLAQLPPQLKSIATRVIPVIAASALPPPPAILSNLPLPIYIPPLRPRKHDRN